jgi:hypothetical protein
VLILQSLIFLVEPTLILLNFKNIKKKSKFTKKRKEKKNGGKQKKKPKPKPNDFLLP